jgi:glycolate oxidase subunit GlcD
VCNLALSEAVGAACASLPKDRQIGPLHFSPDPSSQRASTVGGNAATNAGGINTLKYGVTSNHILGVEMVLPDGEILTTRPGGLYDGIGPDLPGLICGSEGTLGIITKLWCRLVPKPRAFRTVYAVFRSTAEACKTVSDVIAAGIIPTSMEMMDGAMIRVVEEAFHYGFPGDARAVLLVEIDGVEQVLDDQIDQVMALGRQNHATELKMCADAAQREKLWNVRKRAFAAIGRISHSYVTQDACVPRSLLPEAMEKIGKIGEKWGLKITSVFHAGDGNVHPILLFDEYQPAQVQQVLRCAEEILGYCISIGGTITGEHGVGIEKLHLMTRQFGPATIDAFNTVKNAFDPGHRRQTDPQRYAAYRAAPPHITQYPRGCPMTPAPGSLTPGIPGGAANVSAVNKDREPPIIVDRPEALAGLVSDAAASGVPLVDYGVAHDGLGHSPPARHRRFCLRAAPGNSGGVIEHYQRDFAVRVDAGATVGSVMAALQRRGQFLPIDADSDLTIGEAINHNLYGPLRAGYGGLRDLLLGLAYIDGLGRDVRAGGRTVKNVAGYDLTRFMVGGLGELGVVHEATLRTFAIPEAVLQVVIHAQDLAYIDGYQTDWLTSDAVSTHLALYWEPGRWLLCLGYFGSLHACAVQVRALERLLERVTHMPLLGMQQVNLEDDIAYREGMRSWRRRPEVSAVVRIIVPPAVSGRLCQKLLDWARREGFEPHINCLPIFGMVMIGGELSAGQAESFDRAIREAIAPTGGVRTWVRRPEGENRPLPFFPKPPEWPILLRLKKACDPHGILNPGRLIPVDGGGEGRA